MSPKTFDLKGNEVMVGDLPGVGTRIIVNENVFRIVYTRQTPVFSFTAQFVKKYEPTV